MSPSSMDENDPAAVAARVTRLERDVIEMEADQKAISSCLLDIKLALARLEVGLAHKISAPPPAPVVVPPAPAAGGGTITVPAAIAALVSAATGWAMAAAKSAGWIVGP